MATEKINIRDINPLEHITSDIAKAGFNYKAMLNGLVEWNNSKLDTVTVRLMSDVDPGFVDYTFPSKKSIENSGTNAVDADTFEGAFSYNDKYPISAMISEDSMHNDRIDIRVNVIEGADASWQLYASATIYDEEYVYSSVVDSENGHIQHSSASDSTSGNIIVNDSTDAGTDYLRGHFIRIYYPQTGYAKMKWVNKNIFQGNMITERNTNPVFEKWSLSRIGEYMRSETMDYLFVVHNGKVYRPTGTITRAAPNMAGSGWEYFCDEYGYGNTGTGILEHGKVYLYDPDPSDTNYTHAELFIYNGADTQYGYPPFDIEETETTIERRFNDGWETPSVILLPVSATFSKTTSIRWETTTDIEALVIYRVTSGSPDKVPYISLLGNVRITGDNSEDNGGFAVFDTSNYAEWPSPTPKWIMGHNYYTDTSKDASELQNYSAVMVFDHASENCKQCNIVNYDGPDLDQGLAIYLPVESTVNDTIVYPKNGRTFEFLFRIWPNPGYNGHETSDLIINKAQIYVYSVPQKSNLKLHGAPIAKFSMARLTNFYVFSENIAIPNRPVLIKAKFVYSGEDQEWKTYDYYQIPDCVFLSPGGFVDPGNSSDGTYGVETAGFPLIQDPFSNYDLSPVLVDDEYRNRIG